MRARPALVTLLAVLGALVITLPFGAARVASSAGSPDLVISQVYGGGGNVGAPFDSKFVELFNRGSGAAALTGLSVQYASATGTAHFAANVAALPDTVLPAGGHFLLRLAGGANGAPLPTPDATGTINPAAGSGKFILARTSLGLACNGGSVACSAAQLGAIADLVGYGTANWFEGTAAAPTLSNTNAAIRNDGGCADTDDNGADFTAGSPTPRNSASPLNHCAGAEPTADPTAEPTSEPSSEPTAEPSSAPTTSPTQSPFDFAGFLAPVANAPTVNSAKAGSSVVLHFRLGGDHGLDILADGYPSSARRSCASAAAEGQELAGTPGGSGLSYDSQSDKYTYVWKTEKAWSGTCRRLVVRLVDGTFAEAEFSFR